MDSCIYEPSGVYEMVGQGIHFILLLVPFCWVLLLILWGSFWVWIKQHSSWNETSIDINSQHPLLMLPAYCWATANASLNSNWGSAVEVSLQALQRCLLDGSHQPGRVLFPRRALGLYTATSLPPAPPLKSLFFGQPCLASGRAVTSVLCRWWAVGISELL